MIGSSEASYKPHQPTKKTRLRVAVEGNIASGKSTLLRKLSQLYDIEVLIEPVDQWRNIGGGNLIDPKRWSYLFQSYVFLTMMELHHKEGPAPISMLERSVFSARYCFVENLHRSGLIDDVEFSCYCRTFDYMTSTNPPHLDLIVYLRTTPEVCYHRLLKRGRKEEQPVQLSYLQSLHDCYENWLGNKEHHSWHGNTPVLVINGDDDISIDKSVYSRHSSRIISVLDAPSGTPTTDR